MDERTQGQLRVIRKVVAVTQAAGISVWLFGGWGLDARIGRITRSHGDIEFWVERIHAEQSKAARLPTRQPESVPWDRGASWPQAALPPVGPPGHALLGNLPAQAHGVILDLGCGTGSPAFEAAVPSQRRRRRLPAGRRTVRWPRRGWPPALARPRSAWLPGRCPAPVPRDSGTQAGFPDNRPAPHRVGYRLRVPHTCHNDGRCHAPCPPRSRPAAGSPEASRTSRTNAPRASRGSTFLY